jgi:DNA-binding NarL/FixJ family response regulator
LGEGRPEEALAVLSEACRRWHDIGARYDAACACRRLADAYRAVGDEDSAAAEAELAKAAFEQLGAPGSEQQAPDGLTGRECEVLALVADGRSNAEIGAALFISDRTVARHLTNIFHKIDVTSRTQAARYAIEHRLAR